MNSRILLFISLFLTFAFSVIGWAVVINALVKSNDESSYVKSIVQALEASGIVDINYHDIYSICAVIAAVCALLTALSLVSTVSQIFSFGKKRFYLRLQAYLMLFGALWLLATVIACDVIFATRSTKVTVTLGGIVVPQSSIQPIQQAIGISPEYKQKWYLKLCAILPWFASLFATVSGLLLLKAARDTTDYVITEEREQEKVGRPSNAKQVE